MSTDFHSSSTAVRDPSAYRRMSTLMPPARKTAAVARVRYLEHEVFDGRGRVRRGIDRARAEQLVTEINDLRDALGWLQIDLDGRWRWPG
jgi:hypothetical protein